MKKSFHDGGLTATQLIFLYESYIQRENQKLKLQAALHGIKLDDEITPQQTSVAAKQDNQFLFRDPKEYEQMSPEERESLTKKMMQHYSSIKFFGGGAK